MVNLLGNRYRLDSELGRGGMGVVYRAHDTLLDRDVAVKVLSDSGLGAEGRARLLREAQAVAKLNHPNIIAIYDVAGAAEADGVPFIVMEWVGGQSLYAAPPRALGEIVLIAKQLCSALDHAHTRGIIHRDLKPENVVVLPDGNIKLMAFGLARSVASRLTGEGALVGTVFYLAPEQALGQDIDGRADLYSLGVMLYELTAGRLPFTADDPLAVISQHLHAPVVPPRAHNEQIPPALDALIVRLLSKQPEDRPASAHEVLQALEQLDLAQAQVTVATELPLLERIVRGRLVGREREMAEASAYWKRAAAGQEQVLLISGEPGVGKTRLGREIATRATVSGGKVLLGECYAEGGAPYAPIAQMIRAVELAGLRDLSGLPDLLILAPDLRHAYPDVPPAPRLDPPSEQERLFDSVVELCQTLAVRTPLLLIVDDAHWADSGTLALLRHLARRLRQRRVMLLLTYRETELDEARPFHQVLLDLTRERLAVRIKLARLSKDETRDLLAAMLAQDIAPEFLDSIYHETEGNPFFIEEVCKALIEEGKLYHEGGRWRGLSMAEMRVPQSVRVAVQARVGKLPAAAQDALGLAAILGREFDFETLQKASDQDEETLVAALEVAERAQLIGEVQGKGREVLAFAHSIIPTTLRESMSGLRRHRLHRRVAAAIELLRPDDLEALAYHYSEAGDEERARAYYIRAADRARKVYANEDALRFYAEALALTPDDHPDRFDLLAARAKVYDVVARRDLQRADVDAMLALAERRQDDARRFDALIALADFYLVTERVYAREPAERAAGIARAMGDRMSEAHALRRLGWVDCERTDYAASRRELETAAALFREGDQPGEAAICLHILSLTLRLGGDLPGAQQSAEQAVALSRAVGDKRQEAISLRRLGIVYGDQKRRADELAATEAALALHCALGDRFEEMHACDNLGTIYAVLGRPAEAEASFRRALEIAEAVGSSQGIAYVLENLMSHILVPQGEYEAGLMFLEEHLTMARLAGDEFVAANIQFDQAWLLAALGQFARALDLAQAVAPCVRKFCGPLMEISGLALLGRWQAALGQFDPSRQALMAALDQAGQTGVPLYSVWPLKTMAYTAWLEGGRVEALRDGLARAQQAIALLAGLNEDHNLAETLDLAARLWLALGEPGEALKPLTEMVRLMDANPTLFAVEQLLWTRSRVLRALGREAEADECLRRAHDRVMLVAGKTLDATLRRSWLGNVRENQEIVMETMRRGLAA